MFTKSARFRTSGPNSADTDSKTSANLQSLEENIPVTDSFPDTRGSDLREIDDDDIQSGSYSVRNINSVDSERSQTLKRPISTDRKIGPPDKKKTGQRDLKRTSSFIPRATIQRSKTPSRLEVKKTERKSETSLKDKESLDGNPRKDKSYDPLKNTKMNGESDDRRVLDNARISLCTGRGSEQPTRNQSITRVHGRNSYSRGSYSLERAEPKITHKANAAADEFQSKNLESQYLMKKAVYKQMVKEFTEKQKNLRDHYKLLQELRKKILVNTGKDLQHEELIKINDIGPPFVMSPDLLQKNMETLERRGILTFETKIFNDIRVDFTDFQNNFESNLNQIRDKWFHLISILMNNRQDIMLKIQEKNIDYDLTELEKDEKGLEFEIENAKHYSKLKMDELSAELKKMYTNRETLKQELKTLLDNEKITNLLAKDLKELATRLKEVEEELAKEKIRTEDLKEKKNMLEEANLAEAEKIETLEQTIASQHNQIIQLACQCKQLKQKDLMANRGNSGLKAKDLKDLKAKSELLKALENHMTELTSDYNAQKRAFEARIAELERSLKEKEEALRTEGQAKQNLELSLAQAEENIRNVREKKKVFAEMVDKTKHLLQITNSGSTKREEQLWTELEATKIIVKGYQDQLHKLAEEKKTILLKFQTISEDKSNQNTERVAADLVRKDEIIKNLKEQLNQLQNSYEEQSTKYNKLLAQIREAHEKSDGKTDAAALSKQLGDMKMEKRKLQEVVKDLVNHNEELETALVQRSLELDQRDRLVKQQCNLLKMRDELTDLVRSKDDAQYQGVKKAMEHGSKWEKKAEKIYKDLEKKANELDDMYKILVEKQKQVEKLTKLVKIMEDQQDKAQEQRVRFESKITDLQRQISEGKHKQTKAPLFVN